MHISAEGKIGIGLGLIGLLGAGVLVVVPVPWVQVTGWAMIAVAVIGLLLLAAHHIAEYVKKRRADKRKATEGPSKEELMDLYARIEALKVQLEADDIEFNSENGGVNFATFHEVFAVTVSLIRIGVPSPMTPKWESIVEYENFNRVMYRFLSAISPLLRNGDIELVRSWAKRTLETLQGEREAINPRAAPPPVPERQGTPEKT